MYLLGGSSAQLTLPPGVHTLRNVPASHPIGLIHGAGISYTGEQAAGISNGVQCYTGSVWVTVTGDFGTASLWCANHGSMGGTDRLRYGPQASGSGFVCAAREWTYRASTGRGSPSRASP